MRVDRRVGLALSLLLGLAGCVTHYKSTTHLDVKVTFETSQGIDQLRFTVLDGVKELKPPTTLPAMAAAPLESGTGVAILLPDSEVGRTVKVRVVGIKAGQDVRRGENTAVVAEVGQGQPVLVVLDKSAVMDLHILPDAPTVAEGANRTLRAVATLADGGTEDLTEAIWTSADPTIATVDASGTVHGLALGQVKVTAVAMNHTAETTLSVITAEVTSLSLTPDKPLIPLGRTLQFTATAGYSDGSNADLTSSVAWSTTNPLIASVTMDGKVTARSKGPATITATLGLITGKTDVTVGNPELNVIEVTPTNPKIAPGATRQLFATGIYTDGSTSDITSSVMWSSTTTTIATVSMQPGSKGLVTGLTMGSTSIVAMDSVTGVMGLTVVQVSSATLVSMMISPTTPTVPRNTPLPLSAIGTFSDATVMDVTSIAGWVSSAPLIATVGDTAADKGLVTSLNTPGPTTVTATIGGVFASTVVTVSGANLVSIAVTPPMPDVPRGLTQQLQATGTYSDTTTQDLTSQVTWMSTMPSVASVSTSGLVKGLAAGASDITATLGAVNGSTTVTVTSATLTSIPIDPPQPTLALGTTLGLTATGTFSDSSTSDLTGQVTWASSQTGVVTVSNSVGSHGLLTPVAAGMADITATLGTVSGTTHVSVTGATLTAITVAPTAPTIPKNNTQQFSATGLYSDNSTQDLTATATWSSSNTNVATISNANGTQGLASGVGGGGTTITAQLGGISGSTMLTVTVVTLVSIAITPADPTVSVNGQTQFTATGTYSDSTTLDITGAVTWSSSSLTIATISNAMTTKGKATGVGAGTATITAALTGVQGTTTLTVTTVPLVSIAVTPGNLTMAAGTQQQYTATGTYSDNSMQDITTSVTWSIADANVASVTNTTTHGKVSALAAGSTMVTATLGAISGATSLTVSTAALTSISVTPKTAMLAKGATLQYTATGTYANMTMSDVTMLVTWSTGNSSIATASNGMGTVGQVTGVATGGTTVIATLGAISGNTTVTITAPVLKGIVVTPTNPTIGVSQTLQFTATGVYTDNTMMNLTSQVTWSTMPTSVATIVKMGASIGLATGVAVGQSTVSARMGPLTGVTTLTVQ